MELAIFGAIALGMLSFFLGTLASEFGAIRAQAGAFRLCLKHAGEDNTQFVEPRAVAGYLQLAVPSASLQSWDLSANEARAGCFTEWGTHITMPVVSARCGDSPAQALFFGYSGPDAVSFDQQAACSPGQPIDTQSTINSSAWSSTEQRTASGTTRGTTKAAGGANLSTMFIGGSAEHGTGYGTPAQGFSGSTTAP